MPVRELRPDEKLLGRPPPTGARPLRPGELRGDVPPSRTGIIPEEKRREVRERVQSESFLFRLFLEGSPAAIGTFFGGLGGAAFGGVGVLPGAVAGGLFGEFVGQELGLTPQSDVGLAIAGGGPVAGRVAAPFVRPFIRGTGKAITALAPARAAVARKAIKDSVDELSSFGAKVLSKQKGIMKVDSSKIYQTVRGLGVKIDPRNSRTVKALDELEVELAPIKGFPEVIQARRTILGVKETLNKEAISFNEIITSKQLVGAAVRKARRATGIKLRTPKTIFKAMEEDLGALRAKGQGLKGTAARLLKKAETRAKLEFSVGELEEGLARNLKFIPEEESVVLNVNGFRNWLGRVTNPNHKDFNENFAESLKDEIPDLMKRLAEIDKIAKSISPGGPASLVLRGSLAGTGALVGLNVAGEAGAMLGAIGGAHVPEMLTAMLLSKPGSAFLVRAARAGRGTVNEQAWANLGQILTQAMRPALETTMGRIEEEGHPFR